MSDDKSKRGEPDRSLVSTKERYEVQYWTKEFGCTEAQLLAAVAKVGHSVAAVRRALGK